MLPESNEGFDVAVWGNGFLFTHTILSPTLIVASRLELRAVDRDRQRHRTGSGTRRALALLARHESQRSGDDDSGSESAGGCHVSRPYFASDA
jgi:hypothetical protein